MRAIIQRKLASILRQFLLNVKSNLVLISVDYEGHDGIANKVTEFGFRAFKINTVAHLSPVFLS